MRSYCYNQENLDSDIKWTAESATYKNVVNPWGLVLTDHSFWVSLNGKNMLGHFKKNGELIRYVNTTGPPTGLVLTENASGGRLVVVTRLGTIEIYDISSNDAATTVVYSDLISQYTGITFHDGYFYVANFSQKRVDVFNNMFVLFPLLGAEVTSTVLTTLTPNVYSPFNVYSDCKKLFISYARLEERTGEPVSGIGNGYIEVFYKYKLRRLVSRDSLNAPWGMSLENDSLLVGNHGNGLIDIFLLPCTKVCRFSVQYCGNLQSCCNKFCEKREGGDITNDGLWAVVRDCTSLFITAGSDEGNHGLIAALRKEE